MNSKLRLADRITGTNSDVNVWCEILDLTSTCNALNLSVGCPDFRPPEDVLQSLSDAAIGKNHMVNHYTRARGHPRLVEALSRLYSITLQREVNPMTNINVTVGAFEALYCSFMGLINPGDEVILIEPFYEPYQAMLRLTEAVIVYVPLHPKETSTEKSSAIWTFDFELMRKSFNSKTKAIVVNNPSNPLGKVFTSEELNLICELCKHYDTICIADEVYEWLVYGSKKHIRIASLPGMWERTITIGSAGKSFSVTGWKVGWAIGPENLIQGISTLHETALRTCPTPTQEAIAVTIEKELFRLDEKDCHFYSLSREMEVRRNRLCQCLRQAGIEAFKPDGGYFIIADISKLDTNGQVSRQENGEAYDLKFVKWAIKEKSDETLERARDILQKWDHNDHQRPIE